MLNVRGVLAVFLIITAHNIQAQVKSGLPPQITSFKTNIATFVSGQSLQLSWESLNATKLQLDPGAIVVTGKVQYTVTPSSETTYRLTATNASGSSVKSVIVKPGKILSGDYIREPYALGCVPRPNTDYMQTVLWGRRIEPRDCASVKVANPVFVWSLPMDLITDGIMNFTLKRSSDGLVIYTAATSIPRLLLPPSKALSEGMYEWSISYTNKSKVVITSQTRRLGIAKSNQFIVPSGEQIKNLVLQKPHPRILPAGSSFASIASLAKNGEYAFAYKVFLDKAESLKTIAIIAEPPLKTTFVNTAEAAAWASKVGNTTTVEVNAFETLSAAYLFTGNLVYRTKAFERFIALSKWSPTGATSETSQDQANRQVYVTLAMGLDLFHNDLTDAQKAVAINSLKLRLAQIFSKFRSLSTTPLDSHAMTAVQFVLQTLMYVAGTPGLEAETNQLASLWETLITTSGTWGGGVDGGFGNGTAYGWFSMVSTAKLVANIKLVTGVNIIKYPPLGNIGFNQIAQTPPAGKLLGQMGDGIETTNSYFDYSYNEFRLLASVAAKPEYEWYWRAHPGNLKSAGILSPQHFLMLGVAVPQAPIVTPTLPNSFLFEQAGYVAMHSDSTNSLRSSVFFRSSYLGSLNHSHADNNGFTFVSQGKEMLISGGYYPFYASEHHLLVGRATRFKNAITFDGGIGQSEPSDNPTVPGKPVFSMDPSGKLTNFIDNGRWVISTGDATLAYSGQNPITKVWKPLLKNAIRTVAYNREKGLIIIYDWATSDVNRKWELNFQTLAAPLVIREKKTIQIQNGNVRACIEYHGKNGTFTFTKNFPVAPEAIRADQYQTRLNVDVPSKELVAMTVIRENCGKGPIVSFISGTKMVITIDGQALGFNQKTVQIGE